LAKREENREHLLMHQHSIEACDGEILPWFLARLDHDRAAADSEIGREGIAFVHHQVQFCDSCAAAGTGIAAARTHANVNALPSARRVPSAGLKEPREHSAWPASREST
jgi:hypothetical protein